MDVENFVQHAATPGHVFFERSVLDALCGLNGVAALNESELSAWLSKYEYCSKVFLLPPWKAIYVQDAERDHTFEHAEWVYDITRQWYRRHRPISADRGAEGLGRRAVYIRTRGAGKQRPLARSANSAMFRNMQRGGRDMNPYDGFRMTTLVALAIAVCQFAGAASAAAPLPTDPCALLKPSEIQTLDSNATIGSGVLDSSTAPMSVACTYTWGPRTREWGESGLTVAVIDASKGWPGVSPDLLQQGILAKVKASGPNASQVTGVGDAAAFTFEERASNATVEAYFKAKGVHLAVTFHCWPLARRQGQADRVAEGRSGEAVTDESVDQR